jgi:predicted ATPase
MPWLLSAGDLEALQRKVLRATPERMLREMAKVLEALTAERPLVLALEDLHWSDPSTLDLLSLVARRTEPARLLIIGTYRPLGVIVRDHPLKTVKQELQVHNYCQELELEPLSEAQIVEYLAVRGLVGARRAVPLQLARLIHQRTEGNPLFLVSVVDDLIARGMIVQTDTNWELREEPATIESRIPDNIRHLVALQSGRLSPVEQQTLEAASVAGMEFSAASVAAALATDTEGIERLCEHLAERQHFLRRVGIEEWPDGTLAARYSFLHALYQQSWHERVSPTQLQHYHLHIGERKERAYGEGAREIAVELAIHFEQGRDYRKAVQYLQQAGGNAVQRSANVEAISHLTRGLELLKTLPDTPQRAQQELTLQVALGAPLMATKGYAAPVVEQAYARARELCQQVGETPQFFRVLHGLWAFYNVRAEVKTSYALAKQLLSVAESQQDTACLVEAHWALGSSSFLLGELTASRAHFEQMLALYNPQEHRSLTFVYGQDPVMSGLSRAAMVLWQLGYPDQALKSSQAAVSPAQEVAHPFSLVYALSCAAWCHQLRREGQSAQARAEAGIALSTEHGVPLFLAMNAIFRGWALVEQGREEEGIAQMRQGMAAWRATGAEFARTYFLALLAEASVKARQAEEGLTLLAEALAVVGKAGERFYEAELYRLRGEFILAQSSVQSLESRVKEAEACFLKAINIARKQQAKSLELRAAMSLARLWHQQGKTTEAYTLLAPVYHWFNEGFDTKDLQEAKALLEKLREAS